MIDGVVRRLREQARETDERRLLVLAGEPDGTRRTAADALDAAGIDRSDATLVGPDPALDCEHLLPERSAELLGTTRDAVVLDLHAACRPNAIGRAVGVVDGGGLLILLTPPLDDWPDRRDGFDEGLAVPPADLSAVTGNFRHRLVETLRAHPGIAIVDVGAERVERDGLTDPAPVRAGGGLSVPDGRTFPDAVYEACLTDDQATAVNELERLRDEGAAVVVEADRGRGKSSAAGLAAGALALAGRDVLVAAPTYRNAAEVLARARERLAGADALVSVDDPETPHDLRATDGRIRFRRAADCADGDGLPGDPDAVIVDEAAALPVHVLESFLDAPAVAFTTTVHGYEGAGRGFSVRFRDRLDESHHEVIEVRMAEPIRYAAGDPVEVWAFRALLLDARPPVDPLVDDARPETVTYEAIDAAGLLADEHLLREVFGLLVLAHYRTEPDDLARLLDAPNVAVRALVHDGHVVSVALLAREGGLDAGTRADMYDGGRIRGNMLPDVLTTQLRDESAGVPVGYRVLRIATHHAARSRGLGSRLLDEIRAEFATTADWLGVGYGATPELLSFWAANGYRSVHLSTTRNDESGEYSALMLDPTSEAGTDLFERHADQFVARVGDVLADPLADLDPDVARATLSALDRDGDPDLDDWEWRHVASAAFGPGLFDMAPGSYRRLVVAYFVGDTELDLTAREERLLVVKPLQGRPWDEVAADLNYHSTAQAMRALGDALEPLVDAFGSDAAHTEADRYR
ncbi:tRNA cytosine(34) acetyltransferase TmcA [Halorientalis sp. IM1011]|uniref:tRNA(Met) cytidine acetyltransferase TmcA n=1 Tax=Halorientalis sp. IM1011 TaxID=1932360 RepID=UPI00097CD292|nr:tRNA(Met) cytidine acetyltransferase TmcA [Halorientalis sp. IM1011]AQL41424.1 tRNA cytosine(34) acetyltransferase TmcA [Halorientalis sp. IM1011]